ncbi:MAG: hypothetical protein ACRED5_15935 [Propylenella sp.]
MTVGERVTSEKATDREWEKRVEAEIVTALRERKFPEFAKERRWRWAGAVNALILEGELAAAEFGVRHLHAEHPDMVYASNLCKVFDRMPVAGREQPAFADDLTREVQIERRAGADAVLFLFCGIAQRLGAPLPLLHPWFAELPAHLVYLRDFKRLLFLAGLASLDADRLGTVAAFRDIARSLGAKRILCYGNSGGVFPALLYALDLGAEAVLAMAGATNLEPGFNAYLRYQKLARKIGEAAPDAAIDMRRAFEAAANPPRTLIVYGNENWEDRLHAENMAGLPTVTLRSLDQVNSHNAVMDAIVRGEFEGILRWLTQA